MEFRILGSLEVSDGTGRPLALKGAKQRALLATLLLNANQAVSTDRLIDALWAGELPGSGANALQARVAQLRRTLGEQGSRLETRPTGYLLRVSEGELDLHRFETFSQEAELVSASVRASKLREALSLWRGSPLEDFRYEEFAQPAIARLEEMRLAVLEKRIDADLELGKHVALIGELEGLSKEYPLRERFSGHLMVALYRAGRQAEALDVYATARVGLMEELGIEPSRSLKELQYAILRQDAALDLVVMPPTERSLLIAVQSTERLEGLALVGELLARKPPKELIVARPIFDSGGLGEATRLLNECRERLLADGVIARMAAFVSREPGIDLNRLATDHDVDLVVIDSSDLLADATVSALLLNAPCDVAVLVAGEPRPGPVLVPFGGADHDWAAVELAAWLARAQDAVLRLIGVDRDPEHGTRDASRLLATASIAIQRTLGVAAEPVLIQPDAATLLSVADEHGMVVMGLAERWRSEGLGGFRTTLATQARSATLLVRRGLRAGGLAPPHALTRFTWTSRPG